MLFASADQDRIGLGQALDVSGQRPDQAA